MFRLTFKVSLLAAVAVLSISCSDSSGPASAQATNSAPAPGADLKFTAPAEWVAEKTTSSMRVAQYKLPRAEGDQDDAQLVLYYFGAGQGGTVEANLDRWMGQMEQQDGRPSKEKAHTESMTINGLKVTLLDVSGTYTAEMAPGSSSHHNNAGYRLRAAVIETPKGPYFAKLVGPEKTLAKWETEFKSFVGSFEFK